MIESNAFRDSYPNALVTIVKKNNGVMDSLILIKDRRNIHSRQKHLSELAQRCERAKMPLPVRRLSVESIYFF
jgi:hypothetical protein